MTELINGGLSLVVEHSGLVCWRKDQAKLDGVSDAEYANWLHGRGDYARVASWIAFSVGGEYTLKGVCLALSACPEPKYQNGFIDMGTLAPYVDKVKNCPGSPYLGRLPLPRPGIAELHDAFRHLNVIRNRDVHTLNTSVRGDDFPLVATQFVPALNLLLNTVPDQFGLRGVIQQRWINTRTSSPL